MEKFVVFAADRITMNESQGCVFLNNSGVVGVKGDVLSLGCLSQIVVNVIGIAFTFLGAVALIFLLIGAIKFVISRGDPKALQNARNTMTYAVIGTIVVILSYLIITLITNTLGLPNILQNFTFYQQ